MISNTTPESACVATDPSVWSAFLDGVAHTDVGLTIATLILAFATWQLIEDRRKRAIHERVQRIIHPIKTRHVHIERDTDSDGEHEHSHTVIDYDNHPHAEGTA